jgi:hypothetical protein
MTAAAVTVPDEVREELRRELWAKAETLGWSELSAADKTRHYEHWTRDPRIGGVLARYMNPPRVRVYLKDAIFKPYSRARLGDWKRCAVAIGVEPESTIESFIKPHGRQLCDGRVVCWGPATSWKMVLMALHERTFGREALCPFAAVFLRSVGRYREESARRIVEGAATMLRIERVLWLET